MSKPAAAVACSSCRSLWHVDQLPGREALELTAGLLLRLLLLLLL